jgi:iron-sulfur cluster assembly accessory protein
MLEYLTMETMNTEIESPAVVTMTETAAQQVQAMISRQPENVGKALRVFVEGGGCSGLQYGLIFDLKRDGDLTAEFHGVEVLVDDQSAPYLKGAVIDYSDALTGGGFKISNPNAQHSCGCGKSFEP